MTCRLCTKRGKPKDFASDPQCAFEGEEFSGNWNCATMNVLRWLACDSPLRVPQDMGECPTYNYRVGDVSLGVLPGPGDSFIVLSWYKERGGTSLALFISDDETHSLTCTEAERAITQNIHGDSLILVDVDGDPIIQGVTT